MRFRKEPRAQSNIVRLGDLVEVVDSMGRQSSDSLLETPLSPAPRIGDSQKWSAEDVLRQVRLRGLENRSLRWAGPETTSLLRVAQANKSSEANAFSPAFVQPRMINQAASNVAVATREYLWLKTGERTEWRIAVTVPPEHASGLAVRTNIESISGVQEPWVGAQNLVLTYKHQGKKFDVELPVQIALPETVVVAVRALGRDQIIHADALAYAPLPERLSNQSGEYCVDMQEIVGKQLRRAISSGLPIPISLVGEPTVISSGDAIEIESVSGSIVVRTAGRALSGGAIGDLINVEILANRSRLSAIVVEPLKVRISGSGQVVKSQLSESLPQVPQYSSDPNAKNLYEKLRKARSFPSKHSPNQISRTAIHPTPGTPMR